MAQEIKSKISVKCDACGAVSDPFEWNGKRGEHPPAIYNSNWTRGWGYDFCPDCSFQREIDRRVSSEISRTINALIKDGDDPRPIWEAFQKKRNEIYGNRASRASDFIKKKLESRMRK